MGLVLVLALIAQPPSRDDLPFVNAQESFVIASKPRMVPPEPFQKLIEEMGDPCYRCRERATEAFIAASEHDIRWALWAARHTDLEIRMRAHRVLQRLTMCSACNGSGLCTVFVAAGEKHWQCQNCTSWRGAHEHNPDTCLSCEGRGFLWGKGRFE